MGFSADLGIRDNEDGTTWVMRSSVSGLGAKMQVSRVQGDNSLRGRPETSLAGNEHVSLESRPSTFGEMTKKTKRKPMNFSSGFLWLVWT